MQQEWSQAGQASPRKLVEGPRLSTGSSWLNLGTAVHMERIL